MKIPNYKKRAALAAKKWKSIQNQKESNSKELNESESSEIKEQIHEPTFEELINSFVTPKTNIKGISILKNEEEKELRDVF